MTDMPPRNYGYRRPTPVGIQYDDRFDAIDRAVFREILALCEEHERPRDFWHGNKRYSISLKKGQCIFKVARYAEETTIDHKRVQRSIEKLKKWYIEMETKGKPYGQLITILNYDEIIKMETEKENDGRAIGERKESERRASNTEGKEGKEVKELKRKYIKEKNSEKKAQVKKQRHGEFRNVLLTDEEHRKLGERFGAAEAAARIRELDEGIERKGYSYRSHYLAILKWAENDKKAQQEAKPFNIYEMPING